MFNTVNPNSIAKEEKEGHCKQIYLRNIYNCLHELHIQILVSTKYTHLLAIRRYIHSLGTADPEHCLHCHLITHKHCVLGIIIYMYSTRMNTYYIIYPCASLGSVEGRGVGQYLN